MAWVHLHAWLLSLVENWFSWNQNYLGNVYDSIFSCKWFDFICYAIYFGFHFINVDELRDRHVDLIQNFLQLLLSFVASRIGQPSNSRRPGFWSKLNLVSDRIPYIWMKFLRLNNVKYVTLTQAKMGRSYKDYITMLVRALPKTVVSFLMPWSRHLWYFVIWVKILCDFTSILLKTECLLYFKLMDFVRYFSTYGWS